MKTRILFLAALVLLTACHKKDPKAQLADLKQQLADINSQIVALKAKNGIKDSVKITDVSTVEVKSSTFTNYVQLQGKVDAQDNLTAYPQAAATITGLFVKPGDHVNKGQVLAQLDNSVLKQNIAQAEAQSSLANEVFQRQKNLWDQKIGTEVQFLQAQTNMQMAQKQVAGLRQQADMYRITAPISGTVDQMDLKMGQAASPGLTGIRLINADNLKVKADVPESYATTVSQGQDVWVIFPDANDSLKTKITFAAKAIDPSSRSFAVEIKLPSTKKLRPNMTAIIKIADYNKSNTVVVPLKAIQKSEQGDYVFVEQNGVAKRKAVKVGATYNSQTEVLTGLTNGDHLITAGASDIEDGDKVKVIQ